MALSRIQSGAHHGICSTTVEIEGDSRVSEKPSLIIVGLPDTAIKEAKDRVQTAIKNSGYTLACARSTINLAPADLKKEGSLYDLPIALCLLLCNETIFSKTSQDYIILGELGLGGEVRPISGVLSIALQARHLGKKGIIVPYKNREEASLVPDIQIIPVHHLKEAVRFLEDPYAILPYQTSNTFPISIDSCVDIDFKDIQGQFFAKRALEIAAAGGHNVLLNGPPGCGKSMLAKALGGILPSMSLEESLEVTQIYSVAGLTSSESPLVIKRPFRSPHHTISYAGLVGGGAYPRPGEISLSHQGVLFLDELPEFSRHVLEILRQPLEEKWITLTRAQASYTYPANFMCIAAMNPCPCGYLGHPQKPCRDTILQIEKYQKKISGPLLDRMDLIIDVQPVSTQDLSIKKSSENSAHIKARVEKARDKQKKRFQKPKTNAQMSVQEIQDYCLNRPDLNNMLIQASEALKLSVRAYHKVLKVASTIRDLSDEPQIEEEHLLEALNYRSASWTI